MINILMYIKATYIIDEFLLDYIMVINQQSLIFRRIINMLRLVYEMNVINYWLTNNNMNE